METIRAAVNPRLLTKVDRLFTGNVDGRIVEILQNARRAGATEVLITHHDGLVTVQDNGRGIEDFSRLLDLGGSGWDEGLETSEDPAGVGVFCLAPRAVTVRSRGRMVTITESGWTGAEVPIREDPEPVAGTGLSFRDDPWTEALVAPRAVFTPMRVTLDGECLPGEPFTSGQATDHPELGCRIEVREADQLGSWHRSVARHPFQTANVLVNFHGQVVGFHCPGVAEHYLHYLVDLTGAPTGIRLMLPARTRLVENEACGQLMRVLELEAYRYLQRRGSHRLPFQQYQRAKALGIELPEAVPTFAVGLLTGENPSPISLAKPEGQALAQCYRLAGHTEGDESDAVNVHLLAALGTFAGPRLVPVAIHSCYDGYSWADLPSIGRVELVVGPTLHESWMASGKITCVDSLTVTARTSDGRVFSSAVCMARPCGDDHDGTDRILVTPQARDELAAEDIWYCLGGWNEDGDTYDTQLRQLEEELEVFWANLVGPNEHLRARIFAVVETLRPPWQEITLHPDGLMAIRYRNGSTASIPPPDAP